MPEGFVIHLFSRKAPNRGLLTFQALLEDEVQFDFDHRVDETRPAKKSKEQATEVFRFNVPALHFPLPQTGPHHGRWSFLADRA